MGRFSGESQRRRAQFSTSEGRSLASWGRMRTSTTSQGILSNWAEPFGRICRRAGKSSSCFPEKGIWIGLRETPLSEVFGRAERKGWSSEAGAAQRRWSSRQAVTRDWPRGNWIRRRLGASSANSKAGGAEVKERELTDSTLPLMTKAWADPEGGEASASKKGRMAASAA